MNKKRPPSSTYSKAGVMQKMKMKAAKVEEGLEKDDYTNHFLSHFGFFDVAQDIQVYRTKSLQSASVPYGTKLIESNGLR